MLVLPHASYFMLWKKDYDWQQYHCNHCHPPNSLVSKSQVHQNKITWVKSSSPCIDVLYLDGNLLVSSSFYVKCLQVGLFIWRYPALCLCWNIEVAPSAMLRYIAERTTQSAKKLTQPEVTRQGFGTTHVWVLTDIYRAILQPLHSIFQTSDSYEPFHPSKYQCSTVQYSTV